MKKKILAFTCGVCLLSLLPGCPFRLIDETKVTQNRIANVQVPAVQVVTAQPSTARTVNESQGVRWRGYELPAGSYRERGVVCFLSDTVTNQTLWENNRVPKEIEEPQLA